MSPTYRRVVLLAALAALTSASAALLSGCKGNTTSAASGGSGPLPAPPIVNAALAATSPLKADPLSDPQWLHAQWLTFTPPGNTTHSAAPTRAAVLYDPATIYIAAICEKPSDLPDQLAVFLDTTASGKESVEITVDHNGKSAATWYRASSTPTPRDDGSPNFAFPMSRIPGVSIPGLQTQLGAGTFQNHPVWTLILAIPLKSLPAPLVTTATAGAKWKLNILRTATSRSTTTASGVESRQSNLSPVYLGAQPVSPYRMAELLLLPPNVSPPPVAAGNTSSSSRAGKNW